ncbi:MAG: hypothetical protein ACE360_10300 [Hyphomicrobiales bacterium]
MRSIGQQLSDYGEFREEDFEETYTWVKDPYRYALWYEFLRLSPSYELARLKTAGRKLDKEALPADFEQVEQVYRSLGNVRRYDFDEWWRKVGLNEFGISTEKPQVWFVGHTHKSDEDQWMIAEGVQDYLDNEWDTFGLPPTLFVAIPLNMSTDAILKDVQDLVAKRDVGERAHITRANFKLAEGRFRAGAYREYYEYVKLKTIYPNYPYWKLPELVGGNGEDTTGLPLKKAKKADHLVDKHKKLSNHARRCVERARIMAESAARGLFPNHDKEKCPHALPFDYKDIRKVFGLADDDRRLR